MLARSLAVALTLAAAPIALIQLPSSSVAQALEATPFTTIAFEAAKKAGAPVLINVTAPWCPTCKAQKPILSELAKQPRFAKLKMLSVDFDSQKEVLRSFGVTSQSTLITYKGATEVGRSTGVTNRGAIEEQLARAI